jgi:hypothetical protein
MQADRDGQRREQDHRHDHGENVRDPMRPLHWWLLRRSYERL